MTAIIDDKRGAPAVERSAIISPCGEYRYRLDRRFGSGGTAACIMINPSTADHEVDDATIRKLLGFGVRIGIGRWVVGNLFARRSKDVKDLATGGDPVGPENDRYLREIFADSDFCVAAWGPETKIPARLRHRWREVCQIAAISGRRLHCWGATQDGHPRHPLMLAYDTPLVSWDTSWVDEF